MANTLFTNPMYLDTTGATSVPAENIRLRLLQWIDDAADIAHDSTIVFALNGVTMTAKIQPVADDNAFGAVAWQIGPFNPGILVTDFSLTTMAHGVLHI